MAPSAKPAPKIDAPSTVALEENRGLAQRLLELRNAQEELQRDWGKRFGELSALVARIADRQKAIDGKLDSLKTEWDRDLRAIQEQKRVMAEDVRQSGQLARKMTEHMAVLDELRESQPDLDQILGPIKRSIQQLALDLEAYKKNQDSKWEQLPRQRQKPAETRDGDEVIKRFGEELRTLKQRVKELEGG
jgi:chromosome segregation ATPase